VIVNRRFQQASDVFALGTVFWELVSKELPFENEVQAEIRRKILSGYTHKLPDHVVDTPLGVLISRCWERDPSHRPKAFEICEILENILKNSFSDLIKDHPIRYNPDFGTLKDFYEAAYRKTNHHFMNTGTSSDYRSGATLTTGQYIMKSLKYVNPYYWFNSSGKEEEDSSTEQQQMAAGDRDSFTHRMSDPGHPSSSVVGSGNDRNTVGSNANNAASRSSTRTSVFNFSFRLATVNNGERESEYVLPNYLSKKNMLNIIMPPAALDAIRLVKQEKFWFEIESTDEPWAIFTPQYPFILTHASSRWYELFNVPSSFGIDFQLLSLISLFFPEIEAMNAFCSSSNTFVSSATEKNKFRQLRIDSSKEFIRLLKTAQEIHNVLCLHLPYMNRKQPGSTQSRHQSSRSASQRTRKDFLSSDSQNSDAPDLANSYSVDTTGRVNGHNMMCSVHAFPVYLPDDFVNLEAITNPNHKENSEIPLKGPSSPQKNAPFSSPTPQLSPAALAAATTTRSSLKKLERSSIGPLSISSTGPNNLQGAGEHPPKVPLYYAILFNELREEEIPLPKQQQLQQQYNSRLSNRSRKSSKISDVTLGTGMHDSNSIKSGKIDDEEEGIGYSEMKEEDEIYNKLDSNYGSRASSFNNQNNIWANISRFWTMGNTDRNKKNTKNVNQTTRTSNPLNSKQPANAQRTHSLDL
jgi:hypothetical protein